MKGFTSTSIMSWLVIIVWYKIQKCHIGGGIKWCSQFLGQQLLCIWQGYRLQHNNGHSCRLPQKKKNPKFFWTAKFCWLQDLIVQVFFGSSSQLANWLLHPTPMNTNKNKLKNFQKHLWIVRPCIQQTLTIQNNLWKFLDFKMVFQKSSASSSWQKK